MPPSDAREGAVPTGHGQGTGQRGTDQERAHPGIRAVVETGRVLPRHEGQGHAGERGRRTDGCDQPEQAPATAHQGGHGDEGPHDVELRLHAQRPQVPQGGRTPDVVEVRPPGHGLEPVAALQQGGDGLAPHPRRHVVVEHGDGDQHRGQRQEERWHQSPGPPPPEGQHHDLAVGVPLRQQQVGDEEAGEDEEDVDAEVAAGDEPGIEVVGHHGKDGEGPDAVQGQDARRRRVTDRDDAPGRQRDLRRRHRLPCIRATVAR